MMKKQFNFQEARWVGDALGLDWNRYDVEQFHRGMNVELEHGLFNPTTNVTDDNPVLTGRIVLPHLERCPDYYTRLACIDPGGDEPADQ